MNPEQQRIAIAEACGWKTGYRDPEAWHPLPDFLHDLNAMHDAEKVLVSLQWVFYLRRLKTICNKSGWPIHATAAQRAEAFLRTIGKWEESK